MNTVMPHTLPPRSRNESKRRYYQILGIVDANTGSPDGPNDQPATITLARIGRHARPIGYDLSEIERTVKHAADRGDLVELPSGEYCLGTILAIKAAIADENTQHDPDVDRIEYLVGRLQEVRRRERHV